MSQVESTDAIAAQNQETLEELAWTIESSQGQFLLILARCNYSSFQPQLTEQLQALTSVTLHILNLEASERTLLQRLRAEVAHHGTPDVLMVFGLERVSELNTMLPSINQVRDSFRQHFSFPIVFWVNDDILKQVLRSAPDFESWATRVSFEMPTQQLVQTLTAQSEALFSQLLTPDSNASFNKLFARLDLTLLSSQELEAAIADLKARDQSLEPSLQASLDFFRGMNTWDSPATLAYFQQSLAGWQALAQQHPDQTSLQLRTGLLHYFIGLYHYVVADRDKAQTQPNWNLARESFLASIAIFQQQQRPDLTAKAITRLERVLDRQQVWEELASWAQSSLPMQQAFGHLSRLAQDYRYLAVVALHDSRWSEAVTYAQQAYDTIQQVPEDRHWLGLYLLTLAQAYLGLGNEAKATTLLESARELGDQGHPKIFLAILTELQTIYKRQRQYLKAFQLKRQQLSTQQQFGMLAFVGAGRLRARREDAELAELRSTNPIPEEVAPEIWASARQQDLQRLLERIGRADHKLIVLHGFSGVGKSSLVAAGVVPALQQRAIGIWDNLPVLVRKYGDWAGEIYEQLMRSLEQHDQQADRSIPLVTFRSTKLDDDYEPDYTPPLPTATVTPVPSAFSPAPSAAPLPTLSPITLLLEQFRLNEQHNLRTVLIFDQFEEFFFAYPDPLQRRSFFEFLGDCLSVLSLKVILSIREDYLYYLLEGDRIPQIQATGIDILSRYVRYPLGNLTPADAKAVIQDLTQRAKFYLEPALIETVVADLTNQLGEVRPIELQIVGAQLQADQIRTLADYRRQGTKEELVKRYLRAVVDDCGTENRCIAELILYLLTDDRGTRPLKTDRELADDLAAISPDLVPDRATLDLVLRILSGSGIVVYLPETPDDRYQLVHDYIAEFIRRQNEPAIGQLRAELDQERQRRTATEAELRQTVSQLETTLTQEKASRQRAKIAEIEALSLSAQALFLSHNELDALLAAVKAGKQVQQTEDCPAQISNQVFIALNQTSYRIQEHNRLQGHTGFVRSVAFSPDSKILASSADDGTVRLWTLAGKLITTLKTTSSSLQGVTFSPDGNTLAVGDENGLVYLWNQDGKLLQTLAAHVHSVRSIAFSPDGEILATGGNDGDVKLWHRTGQLLNTLRFTDGSSIRSIAFRSTSEPTSEHESDSESVWVLAVGGSNGLVKLWNSKGMLLSTLTGDMHCVYSIAFSPDGSALAAGGIDGTVRLWQSDGVLFQPLKGDASPSIRSIAFSPNGEILAVGGVDGYIQLWRRDGTQLQVLAGHTGWVRGVAFSPNGTLLASGSEDGSVRLWNYRRGCTQTLRGQSLFSVAFNPNGQTLVSGSRDGTIQLWNQQGELCNVLTGHTDWVESIAINPRTRALASASKDSTVRLWSSDGKHLQTLLEHTDSVLSVAFSPDGLLMASAGKDGFVNLWSSDGHLLRSCLGHTGWIESVTFSPDGTLLASGGSDGAVRLWSRDGEMLQVLVPQFSGILSVAFSSDGLVLASGHDNGFVQLWGRDGVHLHTLEGHMGLVWSVAFSPDGELLASSGADGTVCLWNQQGELLNTITGQSGLVYDVAFSPDGKILALGTDNGLRLWNFDLDTLIAKGCDWLQDYLATNSLVSETDRRLCCDD